MPPPREQFAILNYNFEIIMNLSPDAYTFSEIWSSYLLSCGWTSDEWEAELEQQVYPGLEL